MINYNPILPSFLIEKRNPSDSNFSKHSKENTKLRLGVVIEIIDTDDKNNISKLTTEYNVMTVEDDNVSIYKNCMAVDGFGGVTDFFVKKYRAPKDPKKTKEKGSFKKQNGSIVMLLCIDGSSEQAVILGSIAHPERKQGKLTKDLGHHMEGEFNGINWKVDKEGALTVTFKSAIDIDGKPKDEKAAGSNFKIEKDGSMELSDNNKEKIRIDKTKKTISISAEKDITTTTEAGFSLDAKKNISMKSAAELLMDAKGSITAKSGGALKIEAKGAAEIKAPSVKVTADSMIQIKGMQVQVDATQIMLGKGGTPAVTMSTQVLSIGNLGAPAMGNLIGPFSSSVFIGS